MKRVEFEEEGSGSPCKEDDCIKIAARGSEAVNAILCRNGGRG